MTLGNVGSLCNKNVILSGTIKAITVDARFVTTFVEPTHLRVRNSLPLVPVLNQTNPVDTHPIILRSIHISSSLVRLDTARHLIPVGYPVHSLYAFLFYRK